MECATIGNKCCSTYSGDGYVMMRCGPWVYDSNLTGKINEYEYKCNNLSANAINLTSSFITAASVMYSL